MTSKTQSATEKPKNMNYKDVLIDNVGAESGVGPVIPNNIISNNSS